MKTNHAGPGASLEPKELVSSMSHLAGALCASGGAIFLIIKGVSDRVSTLQLAALLIFACSMAALYVASGVYHLSKARGHLATALRKLDHAMIYVLIAGSYTPICFFYLPLKKAAAFALVIWLIAAAGILVKMFCIDTPNWVSASLYILMGWAVVVDFHSFWIVDPYGMALIAAGGLAYTAGGIIYAFKRPNLASFFGFHELFHIFVLIGSFLHFTAVFFFMA